MRAPRSAPLRLAVALVALLSSVPTARAQDWPDAEPRQAEAGPESKAMVGGASILFEAPGGAERRHDGVALGFRASQRVSERFGTAVTFTWGLTDWDRAREWVDAGNQAGSWTTEKIRQVARWSQEGGDAQGLHFMGAVFAEMFLVMTYVAVPVCYVGSVGGATSHLQVDLTGTAHFAAGGPLDLWAEGGIGAAGIPYRFMRWDYALGPVVGLGADAGPLRIGGRVLWSPGGLNSSPSADRQLFTASLMAGLRY
jgi:hypothetical protein